MKKFFIIWTGQAFSIFGSSIVQFALIWYLTRETGSATVLATAAIITMLPGLLFMPFIGAWIDRWNRKWIMIISDLSIAIATLGLVFLFHTGVVEIWHIYVFAFFRSLGGAFHHPAMLATVPLLVPARHLVRINSLNQMLMGGVIIISPPLGVLFIELFPMQGVLAIDIITALIAVGCLLAVSIPSLPKLNPEKKVALFTDIKEGFRFILGWRGLVVSITGIAIINFFFTPVSSLLPILITGHFEGGVAEIGWAQSLFGIGIVAGGLILSFWGGFKKRIVTRIFGMTIISIAVLGMGFVPGNLFVMFVAFNLVLGLGLPITNAPMVAIYQTVVPKELHGRLFTLLEWFRGVMAPLGLAVAGPVSDVIGIQAWYVISGFVLLAVVLVYLLTPSVMNIESYKIPDANVPVQPFHERA